MAGSREAALKGWAAQTEEQRKSRIDKLHAGNIAAMTSEEASRRAKLAWAKEGFRESQSQKIKLQLADPDFREKQRLGRIGSKKPESFGPMISAHAIARWAAYTSERKAEILANAWASQTKTVSSLERIVYAVLKELEIEFLPQEPIGPYFVDIYLPDTNVVIECDGFYWHSKPEAVVFDKRRDSYMRNHGYKMLRLPEKLIKEDAKKAVIEGLSCLN